MGILDRFKKRKDFIDIIHSSNWNKATFEEKLDALQKLENHYAKIQGRNPCPVTTEKMDSISECGYYNDRRGVIVLNEEHLKSTEWEYFNYICADTVIHEGYHSFQYRAVDNNELANKGENTEKWKENIIVYYPPREGYIYRFQPLERDTNTYSNIEIDTINKDLEGKFGIDHSYHAYREDVVDYDFEINQERAIDDLGTNYIEKIDEKIHSEYEKIKGKIKDIDRDKKIANRIPLDDRIKALKEQSGNRENVIEKTRIKDTDLSR